MNFGELKTAVQAYIGREAGVLAYENANETIFNLLRVREMQTTVTLPVSGNQATLPDDYIETESLRYGDEYVNPQGHERKVRHDGAEFRYTVGNGVLYFNGDIPDGETVELIYYARPAPLVNDTDATAVLTRYPAIYSYSVLMHHSILIRDTDAANTWAQAMQAAIAEANNQAMRSRYNGGSIKINNGGGVVV